MQTISRVARNKSGNIGEATIDVFVGLTSTRAVLYDENGNSLVNPFTTSPYGEFSFKAADGIYTVVITFPEYSYKETISLYDAILVDSTLMSSTEAMGGVKSWYPTPVAGVKTGTEVVFDWTLGQHQYFVLDEAGLVITPANVPIGAQLTIDLYYANLYSPDLSAFTNLADGDTGVTLKEISRIIAVGSSDGEVRYGTSYWWDPLPVFFGGNVLFSSGYGSTTLSATVDLVNAATPGNATSVGSLTYARYRHAAASDGNIGLILGGLNISGTGITVNEKVPYVAPGTIAVSASNLSVTRSADSAASDGVIALKGGGYTGSAWISTVSAISFETEAETADQGTLTAGRSLLGSMSDGTNAIFIGGQTAAGSVYSSAMDYLSFAVMGSAATFGNLVSAAVLPNSACSNTTHGLVVSPWNGSYSTSIYRVALGTPANAAAYSTLSEARPYNASAGDETRAVIAGGNYGAAVSSIFYSEYDTPGVAATFGSLTTLRKEFAACSGI